MLSNCGAGEDSWESVRHKPVHPKGKQTWIFIGRTDAETEAPILWSLDAKSQLIGKDSDAGKDWKQEETGGDRGWDGWVTSLTQWTWVSQLQLIVKRREAWRAAVREVTELDTTERMNQTRANWIWGCCSDLENTFVDGDSDMCYQRRPRKRLWISSYKAAGSPMR